VEKPFSTEKILNYVERALESFFLKEDKKNLENKLFNSFELIGESIEIIKIKKTIEKLSSTESRVLINGETGTGKELVARKIHKKSSRSKKTFVVLNSALLQEKKYERELFGEEYDNGVVSYGILEKANQGTLLIDEVAEIPLETQASILRVLIDQKFKRINGKEDIYVNIRIISSSSKDLKNLVDKGLFREDLYHRLNVVPIFIPNLQSRTNDIPLLINYFKKKISEINGVPQVNINSSNDLLYTYHWPGNVRELRNVIERVTILAVNESVDSTNKILNEILVKSPSSSANENELTNTMSFPLKEARELFEKKYLLNQLKKNQGNISKTADFIGMERSALHRKLKLLGIKGIN
jgi:two-component system nitrogen regulation response regulator NtrX